jgi:integral membrane protein
MEGALKRYRIMSVITGTALLVLVCVAIPLTVTGHPLLGKVLGPLHGVVLYPLYLITVVQLWYLARLRLWWVVLMLLAGFVPGLAFVMEYFVTRAVRPRIDRTPATEQGQLA